MAPPPRVARRPSVARRLVSRLSATVVVTAVALGLPTLPPAAPDAVRIRVVPVDATALAAAPGGVSAAGRDDDHHDDHDDHDDAGPVGRPTPELAPGRFQMVAVSATGSGLEGEHPLQVRVRPAGGRWGPWQDVPFVSDEGPDQATPEEDGWSWSVPVWTGDAARVQLRTGPGSAAHVSRARLHAIDVPEASSALPRSSATAATTQPSIVTRAQWGADESIRKGDPRYARTGVRLAFVHHTAGTNSYAADESDELVRGIYAYHVKSRGWSDIGYNLLVDRYGRVFEGRAGGVDRAVIGAHAEGFNTGSTGIAVLGAFNDSAPPAAARETLADLLAWKLDVHHVDPAGTVTVTSGGSPRYASGTSVTLPTVAGHRDTGSTSCPGDQLYALLPELRERAAGIGLPKIFDALPVYRTASPGDDVEFTARFSEEAEWAFSLTAPDGAVVRTASGTGLTASTTWDGTRSALPAAPGVYRWSLTARTATGEARPASGMVNVLDPDMTTKRLAGADRYETAAAISRDTFSPGVGVAYVATGQSFADALAGGPAAGRDGAPVLLVTRTSVPPATAAELDRLQPKRIVVLGGEAVVDPTVVAALDEHTVGTVSRLSGSDRYGTAAAVAATFAPGAPVAYVATGVDYPDALAGGAAAAAERGPILLVTRDAVPAATDEALDRLRPARIVVLGGEAVVSRAVATQLSRKTAGGVTRLAGPDRYATAVAVSRAAFPVARGVVHLATGTGFADALAGGPAAAVRGGPLLLTPRTCMLDVVRNELTRLDTSTLTVLGGTASVAAGAARLEPCDP